MTSLKKQIDDEIKGVNVSISANFESLQFSGDGLFETNADVPTATGSLRVSKIAEILDRNLGCFSLGLRKRFSPDCNPGYAVIDSLQVEGHTDDRGTDILNMRLSANRASSVYSLMTSQRPDLLKFNNRSAQPVLSVAGFGKGAPFNPTRPIPQGCQSPDRSSVYHGRARKGGRYFGDQERPDRGAL